MRPRRRPSPPGQHRGQRGVGFRAALVNVRDDGLRGDGSGRVARPAAVLSDQLFHGGRPDRPDGQRLEARQRPGPDRPVRHPPESVQVEPDHLGVARVQAPEQSAPSLPFQPVELGAERRLLGCAPLPMQVFHARPPSHCKPPSRRVGGGASLAATGRRPGCDARRDPRGAGPLALLAPTCVPPYTARKCTNSGSERAETSVTHAVSRGYIRHFYFGDFSAFRVPAATCSYPHGRRGP